MPPRLELTATERGGALVRGENRTFTVQARDDSELTFSWGEQSGGCPASIDTASAPGAFTERKEHTFSATTLGTYCVWVIARDARGAQRLASTTISVVNQAPSATLAIVSPTTQGPLRLGTQVTVRILSSDPDADELAVIVALLSPTGEPELPERCSDDGTQWCFRAMVPGTWIVMASVGDEFGESVEAQPLQVLVQDDQPPCLQASPASPVLIHDPAQPLSLEVRAIDDLDSVPAADGETSRATFHWRVWDDDAADWLTAPDHVGRVFRIPANRFRPADSLRVRVEVNDRMPRPQLAASCGPEMDTCGASAACAQRLTWKVEFR